MTIRDLLEERAGDSRPFLLFEDSIYSFREFVRRVNRAAHGLLARGVRPGSGVALMLPNSPLWLILYCAIQRIGAYAVPIHTFLRGNPLARILAHCDARFLVLDAEFQEAWEEIRPRVPQITHLLQAGAFSDQGIESPSPPSDTDLSFDVDGEALSTILYTSGTTGEPKGVVYRYKDLDFTAEAKIYRLFFREEEVLYTCLPLSHGASLFRMALPALAAGRTLALASRFRATTFWQEMRRYRVSCFIALGSMIPVLLKQPERPDDADNPVQIVLSAGCPRWAWKPFEDRFRVRIWEAYGATDGGGFVLYNLGTSPPGSMGRPPKGMEALIVDEAGNEVPPGVVGELVFKVTDPSCQTVRYYKNPAASEERVKDGLFHTRDLAYRDEEGNFYFAGRFPDRIRRRGEMITPEDVEEVLQQHPLVLEAAVYGVPSELGEEEVMAAVVLKPGVELHPGDLVSYCRDHLPKVMVPRYLDIRQELPKTGTGRYLRSRLAAEGITPTTWDGG